MLLITVLKLRSCLVEDCGSLAEIAVVLANNSKLEQALLGKYTQADLDAYFTGAVKVVRNERGLVQVDVARTHLPKSSQSVRSSVSRFRPTALHWLYISGIVLVGLGLIAAIATTFHKASGGMPVANWIEQDAWALVPTT